MDFQHSPRSLELQERVRLFMRTHVEPVEELYYEQVKPEAARYKTPPVLQDLKRLAGAGALEPVSVGRARSGPHQS